MTDLEESLEDTEAECEALWLEKRQLRTERDNLLQTMEDARAELNRYHHALTNAQNRIRAMESTRGWRLMLWIRRIRNALLGRR